MSFKEIVDDGQLTTDDGQLTTDDGHRVITIAHLKHVLALQRLKELHQTANIIKTLDRQFLDQ